MTIPSNLPADMDPRFREQTRQLREMTEILKTQAPLSQCDDCGFCAEEIVGCPDGAEICRDCFDCGAH